MKRTLIPQGKGGLTMYVPKEWTDLRRLSAGDSVTLEKSGGNLILSAEQKGRKEITLEINQDNRHDLSILLTHAYRKGYDCITLSSTSLNVAEITKVVKEKLLGFEIVGKEETKIVLENISEPSENKYDLLLRRVLLILRDTLETLVTNAEKGEFNKMKEIEELKSEQDRLLLFCKRMLANVRYEEDPLVEWELLTFITHIQHAIYYAYSYCAESVKKLDRSTIDLLKDLLSYYSLFEVAIIKNDVESVHLINSQKKKYQFGKCIELLEESKGTETVLLSYCREIFRLMQIATSPVLLRLIENKN